LTGERLQYRTAFTGDEARLDVRARGFWQRGQQAFFDVRVFDPNANRYLNTNLQQCHVTNEKEKKRCYNERVLQVEHGTFTPLVFSIYGSMGRECAKFYSRLADMIAEKRNSQKSVVVNWIRTKICFALLRSCLMCLRGSRSVNRNIIQVERNIAVCNAIATIN